MPRPREALAWMGRGRPKCQGRGRPLHGRVAGDQSAKAAGGPCAGWSRETKSAKVRKALAQTGHEAAGGPGTD